jgi:hypothetical protein
MTDFPETLRRLSAMSHEEAADIAIIMPVEMGDELHRRQEVIGTATNRIACLPLGGGEVMVRAAIVRAAMIGDPAWVALWHDFMGWLGANPAFLAQVKVVPIAEVVLAFAQDEDEEETGG